MLRKGQKVRVAAHTVYNCLENGAVVTPPRTRQVGPFANLIYEGPVDPELPHIVVCTVPGDGEYVVPADAVTPLEDVE